MNKTYEGGANTAELMSRRKVTVMYSQANLQPLQNNIQPGFQQNIFIQPQKAFMDLGKQKLFFRPVIQMSQDTFPDLARKLFMGIAPIDAESFWTVQSVLINGNQILS